MNIHDKVRAKIAAGVPCFAQGHVDGKIVSLHPSFIGFGMTYSGDIVGSEYDMHAVKSFLIDEWIADDALVSPQTFSRAELDFRAEEYHRGRGPGIIPGDRDEAMAGRIRMFADANAQLLATEPCPH